MRSLAESGLSGKSRRNVYSLLRLLFDVAAENGLIGGTPIRPKLHRPKTMAREKPVLSVEQAKAALAEVAPEWRAPVWTLALTGVRLGELLALRWRDVDFIGGRLMVRHSLWRGRLQPPKTPTSRREIAVPDLLGRILVSHRSGSEFKGADDFVFCKADGSPTDPDTLRRSGIYPALRRAGVPLEKRASGSHAFRHLVGFMIHRDTGSIKLAHKQLGHSNVSTTGNIYTHVAGDEMAAVAAVLEKALGETCGGNVVETVSGVETVQ